jgi:hypothetical protein
VTTYAMRAPCRWCGGAEGELRPTNGQNCVYCGGCGKLAYNAPKTETGEAVRSLTDRDSIRPSQRERIRERDANRCLLCGKSGFEGVVLHVAHILSIHDGKHLGATDADLDSDENLFLCCDAHNIGQGHKSFNPRMALLILRCIRAQARRAELDGAE